MFGIRTKTIVELAEHDVSVTFEVDLHGAITFWLTKESGLEPCHGWEEPPNSAERRVCEEERKAYVAVIGWDIVDEAAVADVVFAALGKESLEVVMKAVLYSLSVQRQAVQFGMRCFRTADAFRALDDGMFSSGAECSCALGAGMCKPCEDTGQDECMFVRQVCYEGRYPRGEGHWWTGLTDCAGEVCGVWWLQCLAPAAGMETTSSVSIEWSAGSGT